MRPDVLPHARIEHRKLSGAEGSGETVSGRVHGCVALLLQVGQGGRRWRHKARRTTRRAPVLLLDGCDQSECLAIELLYLRGARYRNRLQLGFESWWKIERLRVIILRKGA